MSGYAKRMMVESARWLTHNPGQIVNLIRPPPRVISDFINDLLDGERLIKGVRTVDDLERAVTSRHARMVTEKPEIAMSPEMTAAKQALDDYIAGEQDLERKRGGLVNSLVSPFRARLDDIEVETMLGHWYVKWAHDGHNVFDLSSDFVTAMLLTDPTGIDLSAVRLPFRGLLALIPDRFVTDATGANFTKIHICEAHECAREDRDGEPVLIDEPGARLLVIRATATGGEWLTTTVGADDLARVGSGVLRGLDTFGLEDDVNARAIDDIERIVLGMLAYLSAVDRPMVRRDVHGKRHAKPGPAITHWDVGRTVKIDPRVVQAARSGSREESFSFRFRFVVRGHYRNQAVGPGRKERRSTWIAPFWKGPEEGAKIVHTYKPQTSTEP